MILGIKRFFWKIAYGLWFVWMIIIGFINIGMAGEKIQYGDLGETVIGIIWTLGTFLTLYLANGMAEDIITQNQKWLEKMANEDKEGEK